MALRYGELYARDARGRTLPALLRVRGQVISLEVDDTGAEYPVEIDPLVWTQEQKLVASDASAYSSFGGPVAVSGDTAAVGAGFLDAAYVFVRTGTTWTEQAKLTVADAGPSSGFGRHLALEGNTLLVGADTADLPGLTDAGAAYVFVRSGVTWTQEAKLTAADAAASDGFGAVALSGNTAVGGASADDQLPKVDAGSGILAYPGPS